MASQHPEAACCTDLSYGSVIRLPVLTLNLTQVDSSGQGNGRDRGDQPCYDQHGSRGLGVRMWSAGIVPTWAQHGRLELAFVPFLFNGRHVPLCQCVSRPVFQSFPHRHPGSLPYSVKSEKLLSPPFSPIFTYSPAWTQGHRSTGRRWCGKNLQRLW